MYDKCTYNVCKSYIHCMYIFPHELWFIKGWNYLSITPSQGQAIKSLSYFVQLNSWSKTKAIVFNSKCTVQIDRKKDWIKVTSAGKYTRLLEWYWLLIYCVYFWNHGSSLLCLDTVPSDYLRVHLMITSCERILPQVVLLDSDVWADLPTMQWQVLVCSFWKFCGVPLCKFHYSLWYCSCLGNVLLLFVTIAYVWACSPCKCSLICALTWQVLI